MARRKKEPIAPRKDKKPLSRDNQKQATSQGKKSSSLLWSLVAVFIALTLALYWFGSFFSFTIAIISPLFALIAAYLTQKYEAPSTVKLAIPVFIVLLTFLYTEISNKFIEKSSIPLFTIETDVKSDVINIRLKLLKGRLSNLSLDYPTRGSIERIVDLNSLTDVHTTDMRASVNPDREGKILSNAEISLSNINTDKELKYNVLYNSVIPKQTIVGGRDRYKVVYTWHYKGNEFSKTQWHLIENDQLTDKPNMTTRAWKFWDRALTFEEIKQDHKRVMKGLTPEKKTFK